MKTTKVFCVACSEYIGTFPSGGVKGPNNPPPMLCAKCNDAKFQPHDSSGSGSQNSKS
jgi:hypothetical protein